MSLLLPCRGRGIVLKLDDFMGFFCQQNFHIYGLGPLEESWSETGLTYSDLWAGLVLNDVGEFAGSALPGSSVCQEEKWLGIKTGSSSERLLYVIKICLGCFKNQKFKNSWLFFQWDMTVKVFLSSAAIPAVRSKDSWHFLIHLLPGIEILTKWMFEEIDPNAVIHT